MCDKLIWGEVPLPSSQKEPVERLTILNRSVIIIFYKSCYSLFNIRQQEIILTNSDHRQLGSLTPIVYSAEEIIVQRSNPNQIVLLNVYKGKQNVVKELDAKLTNPIITYFPDSKKLLIGTQHGFKIKYEEYPSYDIFQWQAKQMTQYSFDRQGILVALPTNSNPYRGSYFNLYDTTQRSQSFYKLAVQNLSKINSVASYGTQFAVIITQSSGYFSAHLYIYNLDKKTIFREVELPTFSRIWVRPQLKELMLEEKIGNSDDRRVVSLVCIRHEWLETVGSFPLDGKGKLSAWSEKQRMAVYLCDDTTLKIYRTYNNRSRYVHLLDKVGVLSKYPRRMCEEVLKLVN